MASFHPPHPFISLAWVTTGEEEVERGRWSSPLGRGSGMKGSSRRERSRGGGDRGRDINLRNRMKKRGREQRELRERTERAENKE
jgi:hypothetical protein